MKKWLLLLSPLLLLACGGSNAPECTGMDELLSKSNKKDVSISGRLHFDNTTKQDIYLVELNCDVFVDGDNVSTAISRVSDPVYADSSFSVRFNCYIPSDKVFEEGEEGDKSVSLQLKGVLKSRTEKRLMETQIDEKEILEIKGIKADKPEDKEQRRLDRKEKRKLRKDEKAV